MSQGQRHFGIRLDSDLRDKFQYVAAYEGRSMNKQILYLVTACVREFEKSHGPITEQDLADVHP